MADQQLLSLAENVEVSKIVQPGVAAKTTATSRRNAAAIGGLDELLLDGGDGSGAAEEDRGVGHLEGSEAAERRAGVAGIDAAGPAVAAPWIRAAEYTRPLASSVTEKTALASSVIRKRLSPRESAYGRPLTSVVSKINRAPSIRHCALDVVPSLPTVCTVPSCRYDVVSSGHRHVPSNIAACGAVVA